MEPTMEDRKHKSKLHPVVAGLSRELRGLRASKAFEVYGHQYTIGLLSPKDEDWVAEKSASIANNVFEFASKAGKPRISAALMAIDEVSVAELFQLPDEPDMSAESKKFLTGNREAYNEWLRTQIYDFVCNDMDSAVLSELEHRYAQLEEEKREALRSIGPFSTRTLSNG
jgi:hypothetical protein